MSEERKQYILAKVERDVLLREIYAGEQQALESIVDQVLREPKADRWLTYEVLKRQVSTFVGWKAKCSQLRSESHYEVVIDFLDWLLAYASQPQIRHQKQELI